MNRTNVRRRVSGPGPLRRCITETLESRRLLCSEHGDALDAALVSASVASSTTLSGQVDHDAAWYAPASTVSLDLAKIGGVASAALTAVNPTFAVNAAGLPLLTSRADGQGLKVFLDFDGHGTNLPFGTDADDTTFNASEQLNIYDTWRDIVSFFSAFNVNITTVQPATGGTAFAWHLTSKSISGGYAYVGWIDNSAPHGFNQAGDAVGRHSGIAHEIGHLLSLAHQSEYDKWGTKTSEYTDGFAVRDRVIMGVDYSENVRNWIYGRDSDSITNITDDVAKIASKIASIVGGDGYRPDDVGNTTAVATPVPASGMISAILSKTSDVDVFSFTSIGGTYQIDATPTYESAVAPKIELLDSAGNIIASRDDADQRNTNNNDQEFSIDLPAGNYYVRVASSGDFSEIGEYLLTAAPLMFGWKSTDIGNPYRAGTAAYDPSTGTLTQLAAGSDIWATSDQFRFTYTTLTGDGSITARIDTLDNVDQHAKSGVMIRASLTGNSPFAYMGFKPSGVLDPIARLSAGVAAITGASTTGSGTWVRLTRAGNVFTFAVSADGISWTNLGTQTVSMSSTVLIGLADCARNTRKAAYTTQSNISLTGTLGSTPTTPNALPSPADFTAVPATGASTGVVLNWTDIAGETGYAIERSPDGVNFTQITSVAANAVTYTDPAPFGSMRWYYRVLSLSGATRSVPSTVAQVVNKPGAPAAPNSSYAQPYISLSASQVLLNWTDVQGDEGYRVERSTDGGTTWTTIATRPKNYNAYNDSGLVAGTAYSYRITPLTSVGDGIAPSYIINAASRLDAVAGLVYTSKQPTSTSIAWTDSTGETGYRVERSTDNSTWSTAATLAAGVTTWTDTSVSPVSEYYYRVIATTALTQSMYNGIFAASPTSTALPANWSSGDVGTVPGTGAAGVSGSTWTVIGSGNDIWNTADQFHFAKRAVVGDAEIVARVASLENTADYAKAGVMYRESLASYSRYAFVWVSPGGGIGFEYRLTAGGSSAKLAGTTGTAPNWVKLSRVGNVFTGYYSSDGVTWTSFGSQTIAMTATTTVEGLAVCSHNTTQLAKATFDNVTATGAIPNTAPVLVSATATPSPVTGTTTLLHANATDDGGASNLSFTWSLLSKPAGAADPTFSANGTRTAFDSTATFFAAGSYLFRVVVTDAGGLTANANVTVVVQPTLTSLSLVPVLPANPGEIRQPTVSGKDQFNAAMIVPAVTWSATKGSISPTGVWTAPASSGIGTITVQAGSVSASTSVTTNLVATTPVYDYNAAVPELRFGFNGDVIASLSNGDLSLTRLNDNTVVSPSSYVFSYDNLTHVVTFRFTNLPGNVLPDGNYQAAIAEGSLQDDALLPLSADASVEFFVLAADFDHDRDVDFDDLLILSQNYGTSGHTFAQGNADYSAGGDINFDDLLVLSQHYGLSMPAMIQPASVVAAPSTTTTKRRASKVLS